MFFYNLKGLVVVASALSISLAGLVVLPELNGPPFHVLLGALVAVFDLGYRYRTLRPRLLRTPPSDRWDAEFSSRWWLSYEGGSLMLLPAWVVGLCYAPLLIWIARS